MEAILVDSVQSSLRHFMYRNAIFICERLCAEFPSEVILQLLATCYLCNNQAYAAYHILKGTQMAQSRYLFALSCFHMDLLNEAETALSPNNEYSLEVPNGAAGHYLLGLIYRYIDKRKSAIQHFKLALSLDPLFWAAFEELCILGSAEEATVVFSEAAAPAIQQQQQKLAFTTQNFATHNEDLNHVFAKSLEDDSSRLQKNVHSFSVKDYGNSQGTALSSAATNQTSNCAPLNLSFYNTPSPMATQFSAAAPPPVCRNLQHNPAPASSESSPRLTISTTLQAPRRKFVDEGKLRKISGRLFPDSGPRRSTRLAGEAGGNSNTTSTTSPMNCTSHSSKYIGGSRLSNTALRSVTYRRQASASETSEEGICNEVFDDTCLNAQSVNPSSSFDAGSSEHAGGTVLINRTVHNGEKAGSGASEILGLWRLLGEAYRLSCMYKCQDAIDIYQKLPTKHYYTGWVLSQVGRMYFELVDYLEADHAFSTARRFCPYSLDGMDIYSTVLYHLKEDLKLSYLAQELLSTDRLAPQTWCAMGNCYSLQKDHDTALKNFQRAVQVNSRFAYAHTLCGHEHVALEDFDNGIRCFQSALSFDLRHYNAWYGLGMIYFRQEKFEFAEHHFRRAFQINPRSSVIMSYLGSALHELKRNDEALRMMEKAISTDKKNPLPMFQKAIIMSGIGNYDEALEVLEELKEYAPHECSIYMLMGRIYKRKNMHDKAMLHFGLALDLKPSAADVATIKAAIEKLHVPNELDDSL